MNTYTTSEVAKMIGIHPNTVRLYEEWGLIPKAERKQTVIVYLPIFILNSFGLPVPHFK